MRLKKYILTAISVVSVSNMANAQDLYNVLSYTYESNPTILSQRTYLKSLDENLALAISGWRPTASAQAAVTYEEDNSDSFPYGGSVTANQNIFQGFNTIANTKAAEHQIRAGRYQLLNVEQSVLTQAAVAYVDVLRDEAVLNLQVKNEQVLQRDLESNVNRFEVGEITKTDLSQSEAQLAGAKAARIQAEGNLQASRANYRAVVGKMPENIVAPEPLDMLMPSSLDEAQEIALSSNPQIIASKYSQRSLNDNVMVQKSTLLPSLDLQATASKTWNSDTVDEDDFQAGLVLNVPLYDAGANRAKIRSAKQLSNQAKIDIIETERTVLKDLTANWELLKSSKAQISSIQSQIKASELALEGVKQEFLVGARTVLDVLDAEQALLDSRVSLIQAVHSETVASFSVLANLGRMNPSYLGLDVASYNPDENYKETKYKWLSIGVE